MLRAGPCAYSIHTVSRHDALDHCGGYSTVRITRDQAPSRYISRHAVARPTKKKYQRDLIADFRVRIRDNRNDVECTLLIELDGPTHFSPVSYYGGNHLSQQEQLERLYEQQHNDRYKDRYCQQQGWFMLRISESVAFGRYEEIVRDACLYACSSGSHRNGTITRVCVGQEYKELIV